MYHNQVLRSNVQQFIFHNFQVRFYAHWLSMRKEGKYYGMIHVAGQPQQVRHLLNIFNYMYLTENAFNYLSGTENSPELNS